MKIFLLFLSTSLIIFNNSAQANSSSSQSLVECQQNSQCYQQYEQNFICKDNQCIDNLSCNFNHETLTRCKNNTLQECISYQSGGKKPKTKYKWDDKKECLDICVDRTVNSLAKCNSSSSSSSSSNQNSNIAKIKNISYVFVQKEQNSPIGFLYPIANLNPQFDPEHRNYIIPLNQKYYNFQMRIQADDQARLQNSNQNDILHIDYELNDDWQEEDLNNDQIMDQYRILKITISGDQYQDGVYLFHFVVFG